MVLLCISLVLSDVEHLLMCLSAIYLFSFVKGLLKTFCTLPSFSLAGSPFYYKTHKHTSMKSQMQCQEGLLRYTPARDEVSKRCFYFTMTSFYLYAVFLFHQTGSRRTAVSLDVRQIWVQIPTSAFNPCECEQPKCHFSSSIKWINLLSGLFQGLKVLYMQDLGCNKCLITFTNVYSTL